MTLRRALLGMVVMWAATAGPVAARDLADEIARQMRGQGFGNITVENTWLGRTRITATRGDGSREIIVNPNTGEVLRDLWLNDKGQVRAADIDLDDDEDDADEDKDDDDKDEDKDRDNSGKGSGNSGSGSDGDGDDD